MTRMALGFGGLFNNDGTGWRQCTFVSVSLLKSKIQDFRMYNMERCRERILTVMQGVFG